MKTNELLLAAAVAALVYVALTRFNARQVRSSPTYQYVGGHIVGSDGTSVPADQVDWGV